MSDNKSRRQLVRNGALNPLLRRMLRSLDLVMEHHTDSGGDIEEESARVSKHALLLLLTCYFPDEDIFILADSSTLKVPKKLAETSTFDVRKILDGLAVDPLDPTEGGSRPTLGDTYVGDLLP